MKKFLLPILLSLSFMSCDNQISSIPGIPSQYVPLLEKALVKSQDRAPQLIDLLNNLPEDQREGMAFLLAYMPEKDLRDIDLELLKENAKYAYKAREEFPWAKTLQANIFLNDVLPYSVVDEKRECWRKKFYEIFAPKVKDLQDPFSAIAAINKGINEILKVEYNTRRRKPNQSPSESIEIHMASCTGLAILLVDAFRSVGIPARFVGTPSWHDNRGNHSWVEVWVNGQWYATEYYMPRELDRPWFLANAGKANGEDPEFSIYATSYRPAETSFPMVWNRDDHTVHAVNVSQRYIDTCAEVIGKALEAGTHVIVSLRMFRDKEHASHSEDRIPVNVDVFDEAGLQLDGGRTAGQHQDMNDILGFLLEKNRKYIFRYQDAKGELVDLKVEVKGEPEIVDAYME